jgi:hypothetical protein
LPKAGMNAFKANRLTPATTTEIPSDIIICVKKA